MKCALQWQAGRCLSPALVTRCFKLRFKSVQDNYTKRNNVASTSGVEVLNSCWPVLFRQVTCEWGEWRERTEIGSELIALR